MVMFFDEFKEQYPNDAPLNRYHQSEKYLHEMSKEELGEILLGFKISSFEKNKNALQHYMQFIYIKHKESPIENLDINHLMALNLYVNAVTISECTQADDVYFYNFDDFYQAYCKMENDAEMRDEARKSIRDYSPLKACYFMQWLGIPMRETFEIAFDDVSDDGKTIKYNGDEIVVNNSTISNFFSEYKQLKEIDVMMHGKMQHKPYMISGKFIRSVYSDKLSPKWYQNSTRKFLCNPDSRFGDKTVYYSGRFRAIYEIEQELHRELTFAQDWKIIEKAFNIVRKSDDKSMIYRRFTDYQRYKNNMINR